MTSTLTAWGTGTAGGTAALAIRYSDDLSIIDDLGALTFEDVHRRTNALARGLAGLGIGAGDRVAVLCRNSRYFVESVVAVAKLGADVVYLNTSFAGPQLRSVLADEQPTLLIHDAEFSELFGGVEVVPQRVLAWTDESQSDEPQPDEPQPRAHSCESLIAQSSRAALRPPARHGRTTILTSGTTGTPRGAVRGTARIDAGISLLARLPLRSRGVTQIAAPLFHTWGWAHFSSACCSDRR